MITLIPKTTSPFCHEWQRPSHWEVVISSSPEELASSSLSLSLSPKSPSSSSSADAFREGEGDSTKLPRRAYCCAIRLTRVFTWYNLVVSVSRWASMRWSCAMTASRVTPPAKAEVVEVDGVEVAGGVTLSVRGRFGRSWASFHLMDASLMAPMIEKWANSG